MPIIRINELPEGSGNLTNDDVFIFMDDPSSGGTTKKISLSELSNSIGSGGNLFDQDLNTFNNVAFNQIAIGGSGGSSYYVMANIDGNTVTSLDGLNWNGPYNLNMNINHVATNGTTIVAIDNDEIGHTSFSSPSGTTIVTATVSGITDIDLNQIIYGGGYFVVAGDGNDGVKTVPIYGYSSDGFNWIFKTVTGSLANTLADDDDESCGFSDIDYNGVGWNFAVDSNNVGGGVYTTDITETFTDGEGGNYFSMVPGQQVAWNGSAWYYINFDQGSGFNINTDPRMGEWDGPYNPWGSSQEDLGINITSSISDTFCGGNGYLVFSDSDGHISFSDDNGQNWTYVTPIPYTATITDISYVDNKYQVSVTGEYTDHADGEKITISSSSVTGYNGAYFLDDSNFLYTDFELTTPFTAELAEFSGTANLTWSNGQYIDAMDYVNGYFYIGNDDEQIARSNDLINWTIVDDRDNAFDYWNDFNGYSSGNSDGTIQNPTGDINITTNNNSNTWVFGGDGSLTLPTSGTIIFPDNSVQTTAYIPSTTTTYLLHEYADPNGFSTPTSVAIDGMSYGNGQVISDSAFGPNSSRVTLYSDSMFAMVAVNADIETVYYNGESGSDGDGDKNVSSGVSNYRGYYSYHNLISGDDPAIQQIVISKSSTMSGSNRSTDTNNDDFTVTGLSGSDVVIVLNLYWAQLPGPDYSSSTTVAIQQFIDLVMFDEATPRTSINDIRTAFYNNSATIRTSIESTEGDLLYNGFEFYRSFQKVTPSGGSGSGAILEIEVNDNEYDDQDVLVPGTGYQVEDTLTVSGDLLGGTTPTNDVTITVDSINGTGGIVNYSVTGDSITTLWPDSYIIDGNDDQYDIGNFIGTNRTRSTALVTLAYDPIEEDGNGGDDVFPILTVLSTDKTISEGQWVWFEEQNEGAFINHTLSTTVSNSSNIFQISSVDLHNGGVQTAQVLQFDDNSKQSVITGPTPPFGTDSQRIIIQGQRAEGNGEGGDVYVWGGDADIDGGDIKIYAGDADNVSPDSGYGGYVNIDGGRGATQGGNIEITAGYSAGGAAGDVTIAGGSTSSGVAGTVNINSNYGSWVFSPDSSLTLPLGGIITDDVETVTLSGAGTVGVNQTYRLLSANGLYYGITDNGYQIELKEAPSTGYLVRLNSVFPATGYYESEDLITWTIVDGAGGGVAPVPTGVVDVANITLAVDTSSWTFNTDGELILPTSGNIIFPDNTVQTSAGVPSNTGLVPNSTSISNIVGISQANYDALVTKDSSTLYIVIS